MVDQRQKDRQDQHFIAIHRAWVSQIPQMAFRLFPKTFLQDKCATTAQNVPIKSDVCQSYANTYENLKQIQWKDVAN